MSYERIFYICMSNRQPRSHAATRGYGHTYVKYIRMSAVYWTFVCKIYVRMTYAYATRLRGRCRALHVCLTCMSYLYVSCVCPLYICVCVCVYEQVQKLTSCQWITNDENWKSQVYFFSPFSFFFYFRDENWKSQVSKPLRACLMCMSHVFAFCVCPLCMPCMYTLYVCLICMSYMYALYVCLILHPAP